MKLQIEVELPDDNLSKEEKTLGFLVVSNAVVSALARVKLGASSGVIFDDKCEKIGNYCIMPDAKPVVDQQRNR